MKLRTRRKARGALKPELATYVTRCCSNSRTCRPLGPSTESNGSEACACLTLRFAFPEVKDFVRFGRPEDYARFEDGLRIAGLPGLISGGYTTPL